MMKKRVKLNGGFFNGVHINKTLSTVMFPMIRPKDIPKEYVDAGAVPNPRERCDYLQVWYKRKDENNFEFHRETDIDGKVLSEIKEDGGHGPGKDIILGSGNRQVSTSELKDSQVRLEGGRYNGDSIDRPETDIVDIPGKIFISDNDWKVVDNKFVCIKDTYPRAVWFEEDEGMPVPIWVRFVYKKINDSTYKFSHVEQ